MSKCQIERLFNMCVISSFFAESMTNKKRFFLKFQLQETHRFLFEYSTRKGLFFSMHSAATFKNFKNAL